MRPAEAVRVTTSPPSSPARIVSVSTQPLTNPLWFALLSRNFLR